MGVWGSGLYSGDFAVDLRDTIRALSRLPCDGDRLLEILTETEPIPAGDPSDVQHTTFWLVIADQFARRGITCRRAREAALAIIDADMDPAMGAALGMSRDDLRKRRSMLQKLRARLTAPDSGKRRRPSLREPQAFLMQVGDLLVYPTFRGRCVNPYFASKQQDRTTGATGWEQDGWAACLVVDRGRAFDFLAWYRPLTITTATAMKPTLEILQGELSWKLRPAGTCSRLHYRRMELERLATLPINPVRLGRCFPAVPPGTFEAIDDVSIANSLGVAPAGTAPVPHDPGITITGIHRILQTGGPD